ncbi:MAG: NAD(P)/FAD-dependent oxidoreductase [Lachnospiraceae bacterium]|jgi:thioredoxin reductase (NADPH)
MKIYDIAIIGTGPGGLEAALTAKARNKSILLLGSADLSGKVGKSEKIRNYLGIPSVSGEEMNRRYRESLDDMGIEITDRRVSMVYPMGDYFSIQGGQEIYEAKTVIIATGVVPQRLYPGEQEFLGRGVSYCATCDAPLYRQKTAAVIASSPAQEKEAEFLAEFAQKVYYLPLYAQEPVLHDGKIEVVREKPQAIEGGMKAERLVTDQRRIDADGIFILRESVLPDALVPGLETENGHIRTDRDMSTNIEGCFACGDVTGGPYQLMKAAGEGNVAALSAAAYLDRQRRAGKEA